MAQEVFFKRGEWHAIWEGTSRNIVSMEDEFPLFKLISTPFEQDYFGPLMTAFSRQQYWLSPFFCVLYAIMITLGPRLMKDRPAFDLKGPLKYWNLFLAVFSFIGMVHCVPHLLLCLYKFGFRYTVIAPASFVYGGGPVGFWTMCFTYSKYFELIDTLFIILRKKPMMFLHWYHHFTVLLYTWDAFCQEMPTGQYFIAMNYSVHAIMYFYYYLAACSKPPKWALLITVMQITQMIIGFGVTLASIYYSLTLKAASQFPATLDPAVLANVHETYGHTISLTNAYFGLVIYGSYFYLFCEFFVKRYILGSKPGKAAGAKKLKAEDGEETSTPEVMTKVTPVRNDDGLKKRPAVGGEGLAEGVKAM